MTLASPSAPGAHLPGSEPAGGHRREPAVQEIWFTRCPVPTATGIAADLGWLQREFAPDGIAVSSLQDESSAPVVEQHFEHGLRTLFREGGNVPALWTRSRGQPTRLIGLTWIDERQVILVRDDSTIEAADGLKGSRIAVPRREDSAVDFFRAMALHGFAGALRSVGLSLEDVAPVDVVSTRLARRQDAANRANGWRPELEALVAGKVDAVYVKGAAAVDAGRAVGAKVILDLDSLEDRSLRVNNGTPRPITVHEGLLEARPDLVSRFLAVLLKTSDWAAQHREELSRFLEAETGAGDEGVRTAYRGDFHLHFHPDLSDERLALLVQQKDFLLDHAFLQADVDVEQWAAREPLREARTLVETPHVERPQD